MRVWRKITSSAGGKRHVSSIIIAEPRVVQAPGGGGGTYAYIYRPNPNPDPV